MLAKLLRLSKYLFTGLILILLTSCKKDKLEDDKEILIGKWNWSYTIHEIDKCQQDGGYSETLNPTTENITYQMEFFQKGKVKFYENNVEQTQFRVVFNYFEFFSDFEPFGDSSFHFIIYLDNKDEQIFSGQVSKDSLVTYKRPYLSNDSPCSDYINYWNKEF